MLLYGWSIARLSVLLLKSNPGENLGRRQPAIVPVSMSLSSLNVVLPSWEKPSRFCRSAVVDTRQVPSLFCVKYAGSLSAGSARLPPSQSANCALPTPPSVTCAERSSPLTVTTVEPMS